MRIRESAPFAVATALTFGVVLVLMWRVRYGIDFTDEAFYTALPHRFALGDRPFVDELNIAQTSGVLLYPFVKVYVALRGTTGIFMFMRMLYVLFLAWVAWAAYGLGATRLPRHAAVLASGPCLLFMPYAIPGLSYNTLGGGLLAMGLFLTAHAVLAPPEETPKLLRDQLTWGGFTLGAATFAYPSLLVGAVAAVTGVFVVANGQRVRSALRIASGGCLFALCVAPVFLQAGRHVKSVFEYSGGGGIALTSEKLSALWDQFFSQHPELPMLFVATAILVVFARRVPAVVVFVLPFIPWLARGSTLSTGTGSTLAYFSSFALVAPLFAAAIRDKTFGWTIMVCVWVPSILSGISTAWSSGNGAVATGLGFYPGAVASGILLVAWIVELARSFPLQPVRIFLGFAPLIIVHTLLKLTLEDTFVYRDGRVPLLTERVNEGPYKGLYTTADRKRSLALMSADILNLAQSGRTLFYYDFPAGYLIANRRPLVASTWIFAMEPRTTIDTRFFESRATSGDVVFHVGYSMSMANPLDRAVKEHCEKVEGRRDGYEVWRVR